MQSLILDKRISEIFHDEDGWWAFLTDGYWLIPDETTAIHGESIRDIKQALCRVKKASKSLVLKNK